MLYELRYHDSATGPSRYRFQVAMRNGGIKLLQKHEIGILGYWVPWIVANHNEIPCMWSFENMRDREAKLTSLEADKEWVELWAEANKNGALVERTRSILMEPTYYSPEPKITRQVQEFRINHAMPGRINDMHKLFETEHNPKWFPKYDIRVVGWFTEVVGTSDRIFFILEFDSVADEEKAFDGMRHDPGFRNALAQNDRNGDIRKWAGNWIYWLADYSPGSTNIPIV